MDTSFKDRRRQAFLSEPFALNQIARRQRMSLAFFDEMRSADMDAEGLSLLNASAAENAFEELLLLYTAGEPIENLRGQLEDVVLAYEQYQRALADQHDAPQMSPLGLDQLGDYERTMQLVGLSILLHRPDLLKRIAALVDPGYKGEDTLYEDLLAFYEPGRIEIDEWYYDQPYSSLIHSMYQDDADESVRLLGQYCMEWYPAFEQVPWHDGHLRINGTDGDYFGYWAFEAGAVAYLMELDDRSIDHMVYPKDLVAWARDHAYLVNEEGSAGPIGLRCPAGQPCPKPGYWLTPAKVNSRRHFKQGEVMPELDTAYGATIWQWDANQF